jgi:GAF domain/Sel1 repeat
MITAQAIPTTSENEQSTDSILRALAEDARLLTAASAAVIALQDGPEIKLRATAWDIALELGDTVDLECGISGECIRSGKILICDNTEHDIRVNQACSEAMGILSLVAVPILDGSRAVGILEVFSTTASAFNEKDCIELQVIAESISALAEHSLSPLLVPCPDVHSEALEVDCVTHLGSGVADPKSARKVFTKLLLGLVAILILFLPLEARWLTQKIVRQKPHSVLVLPVAGVAKDIVQHPEGKSRESVALEQLHKLADQGDPTAEFALATEYTTGRELPINYSEASQWLSKAAEQDHTGAQSSLGALYWLGQGVPRDYLNAYMWSAIAASTGDETSQYRMAILSSIMRPLEIEEAKRRVTEWYRSHPGHQASAVQIKDPS